MARTNINFNEKRRDLVKIAFALFMRKGYENTTINDILKTAEISKGAMYHYFESKEDILDAVIIYVIDIDAKRYDSIIDNQKLSAWDKFIALMLEPPGEVPEELQQVQEYLSNRKASIVDYRSRELSEQHSVIELAKIINEGVRSGEFQTDFPDEMAEMIYAASQSMVLWVGINPVAEKIKKEAEAFAFLLKQCLHIDEIKSAQVTEIICQQIKKNFETETT